MALSNDLISQFVKITNDKKESKKETIVYGTTKKVDGKTYVQIDGSEILTPVSSTTNVVDKEGERVTVMIKNHSAMVTGSTTSPSIVINDFGGDSSQVVTVLDKLVADKVDTKFAHIDSLVSKNADVQDLMANKVTVNQKLTANEGDINKLKTDKLDANTAEILYAKIDSLNATNANVNKLTGEYGEFKELSAGKFTSMEAQLKDLTAEALNTKYANIDFSNIGQAAMEYFYAHSGLIENVTVENGVITGNLVGVTIKGDMIEGNTIKAEKLVIMGEDGLYYKLNTDGMNIEAEQTDENSLNGSIIQAKSITASKVNVSDLVAFDATIGGFNITENAIYSEVKDSEDNVTRGIYMDSDGQINFGDSSNFIKYYRDEDGTYKLAISAASILYAINGKQYSISDLGQISDYIHIGTYENEPCIELGESDSDFRLIITNTRILFMEGSSVPAYVNNQSLHITKAVVEEEIQQGEFVWKVRQNGNMGLMWKGEA